jgi:hypothetical protein
MKSKFLRQSGWYQKLVAVPWTVAVLCACEPASPLKILTLTVETPLTKLFF